MHRILAASIAAILALTGCAASNVGVDLAYEPTPRSVSAAIDRTLRLPADEKFIIALAPSNQAPGLSGKAEASARADHAGEGAALANVDDGGVASATVQIGHAIVNDGDTQVDVQVRVRVEFEYELDIDPREARGSASCTLKLYAKDGRNRLLRSITLAQHTSDDGEIDSKDAKESHFTLTLGPRESAKVYVAAVADVNMRDEEDGKAQIAVKKLAMELEGKAASPVRGAGSP